VKGSHAGHEYHLNGSDTKRGTIAHLECEKCLNSG
jgi:hypothetical protein